MDMTMEVSESHQCTDLIKDLDKELPDLEGTSMVQDPEVLHLRDMIWNTELLQKKWGVNQELEDPRNTAMFPDQEAQEDMMGRDHVVLPPEVMMEVPRCENQL